MKRILALALLGVLTFGATGCQTDVRATVLVLGDSISQRSTDDYDQKWVPDGYLPMLNALPASGLCDEDEAPAGYWVARVTSILTKVNPDVVVVELGTNDDSCAADYPARIDGLMEAIGDRPVRWMTLGDRAGGASTLNADLTDATNRWPNLALWDYAAHFDTHAEWYDGQTDVHPNAAGQQELAAWSDSLLNIEFPASP